MTSNNNNAITTNPMLALGLPTPLILGSASYTRKLILTEMGIDYEKMVRPIDEKGIGNREEDAPSDLVLRLGQAKMDHLVKEFVAENKSTEPRVLLTADQVVTCRGQILEKPESVKQAREFVSLYGEHSPSTVGSCVLYHWPSGVQVSGVDTATVHFQTNTPASLVDELIALEEPVMSCAGGLMVEHPLVKKYITRIDGTEDSVMGLSKDLVSRLLKELTETLKEQKDAGEAGK